MALVAPLAGAALGGAALAGTSYVGIGMSVGWMVGSWLAAPKQQAKNEIFDPGAEEMPRFNSAIRGATIPILFGTNRVPAQLVWQHDFTTIRKETSSGSGGGGKFGGSGMKGMSGPQNTEVSYQYKWDLVYHFGMTPTQMSLYGGWLGPDRLSADAILSITNNAANSYNVFFGFQDPGAIAQKASIVFEEGFFFQGYGPGNDQGTSFEGWDEIASDEGVTIRWPHTIWIGFKQMDLGPSPHVPQLSFEIGPGNPDITFNSAFYGGAAVQTLDPTVLSNGLVTGDDGLKYVVSGTGSGGTDHGILWRYNPDTQSISKADTVTQAEMNALVADVNLDAGGTYTFDDDPWMLVIPNTNFILIGGIDLTGGVGSQACIVMCKVNSSGVLEAVGGCRRGSSTLNNKGAQRVCGIANEGTTDDPIMTIGNGFAGGNEPLCAHIWPSVSAMNGSIVTTGNYDTATANLSGLLDEPFGVHGSYRNFESIGWVVPTVSVGLLGPTYGTRLYLYIGKADVEWHDDNPGDSDGSNYIYNNAATYPNGWVVYLDFGTVVNNSLSVPGSVVEDNSNFTGLFDDNARVPFDDAAEDRDGSADNNDDYHPAPTVVRVTEGQAQGAYAVLFAKHFSGSEDLSPTGHYAKIRGFIYNPLSTKHQEFGTAEGSCWDTVDDLGAPEVSRYSYTIYERKALVDQELGKIYLWDNNSASPTELDKAIFGEFGDFDISGGSDVLPPYIIYEILTNAWMGLGKASSDIDQSSYELSLAYCDANDFRVSTQYRRDKNALDVIEELLSIYGGFLIISDGKIKFRQLEYLNGDSSSVRTIDNDHLLSEPGQVPVTITKGAKQDTYNKVRVNYFDRSIDYQQNQVEEADEVDQDLFGTRMREFPAQFVMSEKTARVMATRALWANLYSRDTYNFELGWKDADLEPGDVITLVDSHHVNLQGGTTARIVNWKEVERGKFAVTAKQEFDYILSSSASTLDITSASQQDLVGKVPEPAYFRMYELPAEFQQNDNGALYCGYVPHEYAAGAYLWISADGDTFAEALHVTPYPLGGTLQTNMPSVPPGTFQENVEVVMFPKSDYLTTNCVYFNDTLNEAGAATRAIGGALMWIGSEMVAYETVTLVDQNKYRLGKVYRGWGGTPVHAHSVGDFWWKHGGGVFFQNINEDKIGTTLAYKVQPHNLAGVRIAIDSIDAQTYTIIGAHYLPQVPPTPRIVVDSIDYRGKTTLFVNSTIDISIDWRDTSRKSGYGAGGFGIGEYGRFSADPQSHSWRVEVVGSGDVVVHSIEVSTATFTYTSSQNFDDNGAWRGDLTFKVTPFSPAGDAPRTEQINVELWT